jgi:hypothetical protein
MAHKVSWHELTREEQRQFGNGCGPIKKVLLHPPQLVFQASCRRHDFYYSRGGTRIDRKKADQSFLQMLVKNALEQEPFHMALFYYLIALIYGAVVRAFGWTAFAYKPYLTKEKILEEDQRNKKHHKSQNLI